MNERREKRWESVIQKTASEFFLENANPSSLITVTRIELIDKGKVARVLLSVLPVSRETQAVEFAKRHERDIRKLLERQYSIFVPYIRCELDKGEKNRQLIEEISEGI